MIQISLVMKIVLHDTDIDGFNAMIILLYDIDIKPPISVPLSISIMAIIPNDIYRMIAN